MTSKYTTPVARNASFSIYKSEGEDSMNATGKASTSTGASAKAARQAKLTVVQPPTEPTTAQIIEQTSEQVSADLAALQAARRALDAQIKAAKVNQPAKQPKPEKQAKTLADVIAAQLAHPRTDAPRIITTYVLQREAAGQDRSTAVEEVLGQMRSIVLGALDARQPGETYHQAIFRYLGRTDMLAQHSADSADTEH